MMTSRMESKEAALFNAGLCVLLESTSHPPLPSPDHGDSRDKILGWSAGLFG